MFEAAVCTSLLFTLKLAAGAVRCVTRKKQQVLRFDLLTSGDLSKHTASQIHAHKQRHLVGEDATRDSLLD